MQECITSNYSSMGDLNKPNDMKIESTYQTKRTNETRESSKTISETSWWMKTSDGIPYEWSEGY